MVKGERDNIKMAHSSSGLGRRPLKAEITGSNPVCATNEGGDHGFSRRDSFGGIPYALQTS